MVVDTNHKVKQSSGWHYQVLAFMSGLPHLQVVLSSSRTQVHARFRIHPIQPRDEEKQALIDGSFQKSEATVRDHKIKHTRITRVPAEGSPEFLIAGVSRSVKKRVPLIWILIVGHAQNGTAIVGWQTFTSLAQDPICKVQLPGVLPDALLLPLESYISMCFPVREAHGLQNSLFRSCLGLWETPRPPAGRLAPRPASRARARRPGPARRPPRGREVLSSSSSSSSSNNNNIYASSNASTSTCGCWC